MSRLEIAVYDAPSNSVYALQHDGTLASEQRFRECAQGHFIVHAKETAQHSHKDGQVILNIYWPKLDQGRNNDVGWGIDSAWHCMCIHKSDWLVWGEDTVLSPPQEVRDHIFSNHYKKRQ